MKPSKPHFIFYSREYCHLCHDMFAALKDILGEYASGFDIDVIDVDSDPSLLKLYDERVPVLVVRGTSGNQEYREICHYFLDASAVRACLTELHIDPGTAN